MNITLKDLIAHYQLKIKVLNLSKASLERLGEPLISSQELLKWPTLESSKIYSKILSMNFCLLAIEFKCQWNGYLKGTRLSTIRCFKTVN